MLLDMALDHGQKAGESIAKRLRLSKLISVELWNLPSGEVSS
jgi:hypothetical protein